LGRQVPQADGAVLAAGYEPIALAIDREASDPRCMAVQDATRFARGEFPEPDRAVFAGRGDQRVAGGHGDRVDPPGVAGADRALAAIGDVPDPHGAVLAAGDDDIVSADHGRGNCCRGPDVPMPRVLIVVGAERRPPARLEVVAFARQMLEDLRADHLGGVGALQEGQQRGRDVLLARHPGEEEGGAQHLPRDVIGRVSCRVEDRQIRLQRRRSEQRGLGHDVLGVRERRNELVGQVRLAQVMDQMSPHVRVGGGHAPPGLTFLDAPGLCPSRPEDVQRAAGFCPAPQSRVRSP
jgi:hypothetical protein